MSHLRLIVVVLLGLTLPESGAELVAHYSFDTPTTTNIVIDDSSALGSQAYDAELKDDAFLMPWGGIKGGFLRLDGNGDYLAISGQGQPGGIDDLAAAMIDLPGNTVNFSNPATDNEDYSDSTKSGWTFSAWIRRDPSSDPQQAIFAVNPRDNQPDENRVMLFVGDIPLTRTDLMTGWSIDETVPWVWSDQYHPSSATDPVPNSHLVASGEWRHVAMVFAPTASSSPMSARYELQYYVDGELVDSIGDDNPPLSPHGEFRLGATDQWSIGQDFDQSGSGTAQITSDFFEGDIDEVRLYSHALSADEIFELMQTDMRPTLPGPMLAYWPLDRTASDPWTMMDMAAGAHHGKMYNATVKLRGNTWKGVPFGGDAESPASIDLDGLTLEFEFRTTSAGEIQGIGLYRTPVDPLEPVIADFKTGLRLAGSESVEGDTKWVDVRNHLASGVGQIIVTDQGDGWALYQVPASVLGISDPADDSYDGIMMVAKDNAGGSSQSEFRNIKITGGSPDYEVLVSHWPLVPGYRDSNLQDGGGNTPGNSSAVYANTDEPAWQQTIGQVGDALRLTPGTEPVLIEELPSPDEDVLDLATALDEQGDSVTLTAWLKITQSSGSEPIVILSKKDGAGSATGYEWVYSPVASGQSRLVFRGRDSSELAADVDLEDGQWHHLAVVLQRFTMAGPLGDATMYVDGRLLQSAGMPTLDSASINSLPLVLGSHPESSRTDVQPLDGVLDDVRFYEVALAADQIAELAHALETGRDALELAFITPPSPLAWTETQGMVFGMRFAVRSDVDLPTSPSASVTLRATPVNAAGVPMGSSVPVVVGGTSPLAASLSELQPVANFAAASDDRPYEHYTLDIPQPALLGESLGLGRYRIDATASVPVQVGDPLVVEAEPIQVIVFSDEELPADTDRDLSLMLTGTVDGNPNAPDEDTPRITDVSKPVGSTLALPAAGGAPLTVALQIDAGDVSLDLQEVEITERTGIQINPTVLSGGVEFDLSNDGRLIQEYEVKVPYSNGSEDGTVYNLFYQIDAEPPTVTISPEGGNIGNWIDFWFGQDVTLAASEAGSKIYYQINGGSIEESGPLGIGESISINDKLVTVLPYPESYLIRMWSVDAAGNRGPVKTVHYYVGELYTIARFPELNTPSIINGGSASIGLTWTVQSTIGNSDLDGYHVYRAVGDLARARLLDAHEHGYPPPADLRITDSLIDAVASIDGTFTDSDFLGGLEVTYAVTYVNPDGFESRPSNPETVDPSSTEVEDYIDAANTANLVMVKRQQAVRSLEDAQHPTGYWDGSNDAARIVNTAEALNALGKMPPTQLDPEAIPRGLAYLQSHFADDVGAIARQIDTLQRYGVNTRELHVRLAIRALVDPDSESSPPVPLAGWGLQSRYGPDPYHTALAMLARQDPGPIDLPTLGGLSAGEEDLAVQNLLESGWMASTHTYDATNAIVAVPSGVGDGDRYGWEPGRLDSPYVSTLIAKSRGAHRGFHAGNSSTTLLNIHWAPLSGQVESIDTELGGSNITVSDARAIRESVIDTAAVLNHLDVRDNNISPSYSRDDFVKYLAARIGVDDVWGSRDPFLTALSVQALIQPQMIRVHPASGPDLLLSALWTGRGYPTQDLADNASGLAQALRDATSQSALIVIEGAVDPTFNGQADVLAVLRETKTPVLVLNHEVARSLSLTQADVGTAGTASTDTIEIPVSAADHPLMRGVMQAHNLTSTPASFTLDISSPTITVGYGAFESSASQPDPVYWRANLASVASTNQTFIVAYERGALGHDGLPVAGRRVGLFLNGGLSQVEDFSKTSDLIDAAVEWTARRVLWSPGSP